MATIGKPAVSEPVPPDAKPAAAQDETMKAAQPSHADSHPGAGGSYIRNADGSLAAVLPATDSKE